MKDDIYDGDTKVRFSLGQDGNRKLFVIGLNPSTADPAKYDQTMRKVKGFAERLKNLDERQDFDGFVMLNLCALRATNPNALPSLEDEELKCLAKRNSEKIQVILKQENAPTIWAAWGNYIKNRPYLFECLRMIVKQSLNQKADWVVCGELTQRGHPRHPLRPGYEVKFEPFDVEKYLCDFATLR